MKHIILTLLSFGLLGCSGEQISHNITKTQIETSGNKPPAKYRVANSQTMKDYIFETKYFSFKLPTAQESDFSKMGGWWGASHRDGKTITSHLHPVYHMNVSTSGYIRKYGERERAIINNDIASLRIHIKKRVGKHGKIFNATLKTIRGGKENYPCLVKESIDKEYNKRKISYGCFKMDPTGTMVKGAGMTLTYTKPNNPSLAKQYTYQDLKRRAKRTLDSLYIKDGW